MICELIVCFILVVFLFKVYQNKNRHFELLNEHLLITGGSSGIGLALAVEAAQKGASVTILARNQERLDVAVETILQSAKRIPQQKILTYAVDISRNYYELERIVKQAEEKAGPITFLINCAGTSVSHRFEETPLEDFKRMLDINYIGSVYLTRAVLPLMKKRRNGRVVFVSSLAGLIGLYGYTAYSASKFALVGLAEALQMEVRTYDISITVSFPPDTDTPGFIEEQKCKPIETRLMSESGGLYSAHEVATKVLKDAVNGCFMSSVGFEGWMLCTLCSGMTPVSSFTELVIQILSMGIFRLVAYAFLLKCNKTIRQCAAEKKTL